MRGIYIPRSPSQQKQLMSSPEEKDRSMSGRSELFGHRNIVVTDADFGLRRRGLHEEIKVRTARPL
jgi:hypothetical protein